MNTKSPNVQRVLDQLTRESEAAASLAQLERRLRNSAASGSTVHEKLTFLIPYLYGLITGAAVVFYRCHCS